MGPDGPVPCPGQDIQPVFAGGAKFPAEGADAGAGGLRAEQEAGCGARPAQTQQTGTGGPVPEAGDGVDDGIDAEEQGQFEVIVFPEQQAVQIQSPDGQVRGGQPFGGADQTRAENENAAGGVGPAQGAEGTGGQAGKVAPGLGETDLFRGVAGDPGGQFPELVRLQFPDGRAEGQDLLSERLSGGPPAFRPCGYGRFPDHSWRLSARGT